MPFSKSSTYWTVNPMAFDKDDQLSIHRLTDEDGEDYYGAEEGPSNIFTLSQRIENAKGRRKHIIEKRRRAQEFIMLAASYGLTPEEYLRRERLWAKAHLRWMRYFEAVGEPEPLKEDYLKGEIDDR